VPTLPLGVAFAHFEAGGAHSVALCSDGSIAAWGSNAHGECSVPALPLGLTYVEVHAGAAHTVARRSDGSVVAWGYNNKGQCDVPALPPGLVFLEVDAGYEHSLALRSDGAVVGWGGNPYGECSIPAPPPGAPYVEIAAGSSFSVARRLDGTVGAWGRNDAGQCTVPAPPTGEAYLEISAGNAHVVARTGLLCGVMLNYCTAGVTTHGCVPTIGGAGVPSVTATSGFDLAVSRVEGQRMGVLFYGFAPTAQSWGLGSSSYLCILYPVQRTGAASSGGTSGLCDGTLSLDFNAWMRAHPTALGSPFVAGQVFYAQGWFRDSAAVKGTNLSDGLKFILCE
jgi:hypothetical protein